MKADNAEFLDEVTTLRDAYMQEENKGGARLAQQVLTLSEIYSKYDFAPDEFYGHLHKVITEFSKNYEAYEIQEKEASPVILDLVSRYRQQ